MRSVGTLGHYVGESLSLLVVDDPHDFVVPSAGVQVIRSRSQGKSTTIDIATRDMQFRRELLGLTPEPRFVIDDKIKPRKGRATKQRLKGLRP
jgi:hypothetical protein